MEEVVVVLDHRLALAGERGLVDAQAVHVHQAHVRGDPVAGLLQHQVADDDVDGVYVLAPSVPHHRHPIRHQFPQRLGRLVGPVLLRESEGPVEDDDDGDGQR